MNAATVNNEQVNEKPAAPKPSSEQIEQIKRLHAAVKS